MYLRGGSIARLTRKFRGWCRDPAHVLDIWQPAGKARGPLRRVCRVGTLMTSPGSRRRAARTGWGVVVRAMLVSLLLIMGGGLDAGGLATARIFLFTFQQWATLAPSGAGTCEGCAAPRTCMQRFPHRNEILLEYKTSYLPSAGSEMVASSNFSVVNGRRSRETSTLGQPVAGACGSDRCPTQYSFVKTPNGSLSQCGIDPVAWVIFILVATLHGFKQHRAPIRLYLKQPPSEISNNRHMLFIQHTLLHRQTQEVRRASHGNVVKFQAVSLLFTVGTVPSMFFLGKPRQQQFKVVSRFSVLPVCLKHQGRGMGLAFYRMNRASLNGNFSAIFAITKYVVPASVCICGCCGCNGLVVPHQKSLSLF